MFDFSKKYSPESIQQEILEKQNRQKLYGTPTLKKDKEKNSINMLRDPVLLEPEGTNWDRFSDILRQDAYRRYQYMLGKKIKLVPAFRYSTTQHDKKIHKQEQREQDLKKQQEKRIKNYIQLGCACDETQVNSTFSPEYMRKIRNTIAELVQQ